MNSLRNDLKRIARYLVVLLFCVLISVHSLFAEENGMSVYHCHDNKEKKIAITFDDGPHPVLTPQILDILKKYGVKATFFVVGENVENYPEVVERIIAEGHEIGNHTHTHDRIDKEEIELCENAVYELTEYRPHLFRPPEGHMNAFIKSMATEMGYNIILWSIDTKDWDHRSPQKIFENVTKNVSSGSIILMHDYISFHSPTPKALELLLPELLAQEYRFVVVSELIGTV